MWHYNIDEYDYRLPDDNTIQLYDNKRFVAEITFRLDDKELWITNLYRTEYGKTVEKPDRHYGTEIFAILLIHLFREGKTFDVIIGRLSIQDADNNNWLSSIPYYAKFQQYVPDEVGYQLKFYLYEDKESMQNQKATVLPDYKEKEAFRAFVQNFQEGHIRQCKDAYFCYVLDRNGLEEDTSRMKP